MIDTPEEHYRWDSFSRVFVLLEPEPGLVDVKPQRVDVQAARIHAGWELMATVALDEVPPPRVIDMWIRTATFGSLKSEAGPFVGAAAIRSGLG